MRIPLNLEVDVWRHSSVHEIEEVPTQVPMTFFYNFDLFAASVLLFLEGHGS